MFEAAPTAGIGALTMLGRVLLAAVLLAAGVAKLADRRGTRQSLLDFGIPLAPPLTVGLPIAELMVAAALLPSATARAGATAALLLLAAFSLIVAIAVARGRRVECRCFGRLTSGIVGWRTLARNLVLAAIAATMLLANPGTPPPSLLDAAAKLGVAELAAWAFGFTSLSLVGLGAWGFWRLLRAHGRLLLRIEALEQQFGSAAFDIPPEVSAASAGRLVPREFAPAMTARDLEGRPANWSDLLESGPALLLFTSPRCGPCQELRPEIKVWRRRLAGSLRFVLASDGSAEEVRREAADFGLADALVDWDLRLFHAFEAKGTPSAVVVRDDGTIGSSMAAGKAAIVALLAREASYSERGSSAVHEIASLGDPLPDLSLPRLDGGSGMVGELVSEPTVVLFWNPGCGYCRSMRGDLSRWERRQLPRAPALIIVSSGAEATTRAEGFEVPVFLDPHFALARAVGVGGTPAAVLIDAESRIASAPAAGRDAVLALSMRGRVAAWR
jgi:thiol-disulfide isomerase/thioredoxin